MTWQKLRQQILERDNNTCQICLKMFESLDVNHIIPRRVKGLDSIYNLFSVCRPCHGLVELEPAPKISIPKISDIKLTTIQVSESTRNALAELGSKGETYEVILKRLLKEAKSKK